MISIEPQSYMNRSRRKSIGNQQSSVVFADRFMLSVRHLIVAKIRLTQLTAEDNRRFFPKVQVIDAAIKIRSVGPFRSNWRFERCGISVRQYLVKTKLAGVYVQSVEQSKCVSS